MATEIKPLDITCGHCETGYFAECPKCGRFQKQKSVPSAGVGCSTASPAESGRKGHGKIVDIFPEGASSYRACVMWESDEMVSVVDLTTGATKIVQPHEVEPCVVVEDIFKL